MPSAKKILGILVLTAVLAAALCATTARASGNAGNGKGLFSTTCAICHGDSGRGDGIAGKGLDPRPADFTDPETTGRLTDSYMSTVMKLGKLDALKQADKYGYSALWMPAFSELSHAQVTDLISLVRDIQSTKPAGKAAAAVGEKHGAAFTIYKDKCARCHGENFDGVGKDAKAAEKDGKSVSPQPAPPDFRDAAYLGRFSDRALEQVITLGLKNAMEKSKIALMAGIGGSFNDGQRADVVAYLRSLAHK